MLREYLKICLYRHLLHSLQFLIYIHLIGVIRCMQLRRCHQIDKKYCPYQSTVYIVLYLLKKEYVLLTCRECDSPKWFVGYLPTTHQLQNLFNVEWENELEGYGKNWSWPILRCYPSVWRDEGKSREHMRLMGKAGGGPAEKSHGLYQETISARRKC
jgi:hypothetical protein